MIETQAAPRPLPIPDAIEEELDEFARRTRAFLDLEEPEDTYKPYRLSYGVYGQRQEGYQMIRVKVPHGRLTADQMDALAEFSETFCDEGEYPGGGGAGMGHVTTRQDFQFHFIPTARTPEALRHLAEHGLTTREACYNTVRNITGCPIAGACATEAFDVTPYAQAATDLFLRNPFCQNLPRKFKVSFSGCDSDCALGAMHDIGAVAQLRNGERGFKVWVGGGLGNSPRPATLLYDFVPVREFYPVIEAVVRIFDAEGPRKNRNRARIKFMFDKTYNAETFRARVEEVVATLPEDAWAFRIAAELEERVGREEASRAEVQPLGNVISLDEVRRGTEYSRWRVTNVGTHRVQGYAIVTVRLTLGDMTAEQFRVVAEVARRFSRSEVRTSAGQNLVLRDVRVTDLPAVYDALEPHGLARSEALGVRDVVTCPGADTCNLGITSSRGLGRAIGRWLDENRLADLPAFAGTTIRASGCPNSCGQHHLATVGFYGNNKNVTDEPVPHYMLLLNGGIDSRGAKMAQPIIRIPARRIPQALDVLWARYRTSALIGQTFAEWVETLEKDEAKELLAPLQLSDAPSREEVYDWDQDSVFTGKTGEGECAAV
ncbi:MAG TPA: nitrite/sulfite reductase [Candidatus Dormibacteraeota bacterium]|nr:nitrite/sulfite reductase [Candidatus Dormibacteraeota bacterium]